MAPPAVFTFGPVGSDDDETDRLRGPLFGVQFPLMALDTLRSVLPDMGWLDVHGEWGLTWGGCCLLATIVARSDEEIVVPFGSHTFGLPVVAVMLGALVELPLDWSPTTFAVLRERAREYLRCASASAAAPFVFKTTDLGEVFPDPAPEPGRPGPQCLLGSKPLCTRAGATCASQAATMMRSDTSSLSPSRGCPPLAGVW